MKTETNLLYLQHLQSTLDQSTFLLQYDNYNL